MAGVVLAAAIGVVDLPPITPTGSPPAACFPTVQVANATGDLGGEFDPGAIQAFGSNGTTSLVGGIGPHSAVTDLSDPEMAALSGDPASPSDLNLSHLAATYFPGGGVYGIAWNGSAWTLVGQSFEDGSWGGAMISWSGGVVDDLTSWVRPYFEGQGIWAMGWNGSAWLIGGNNTHGAQLISIADGHVANLTSILPPSTTGAWLQLLAWNGSGWLFGGYGLLGTWRGGSVVDLYPVSPFVGGGEYAAAWNGQDWLIGGGGSTAAVVRLQGETLLPAPALPPSFDGWVNVVVWTHGNWLVGGAGTSGAQFLPGLVLINGTASAHAPVEDLTSQMPSSFVHGQVQWGDWGDAMGTPTFFLVGEGGYDAATGLSHGALATVAFGGSCS